MAATETRLLVLGAVSLFGPVNGYQIRRELLSWEIEDWANVKPGSIYSSLNTLTAQGHVQRHDLSDQARDVAVYTITTSGREELNRLFKVAIESVEHLHPVAFHTALAMLPLMPRETVATHLRARIAAVEHALSTTIAPQQAATDRGEGPPHLGAIVDLWHRMLDLELDWLRDLLGSVEAGEFDFAGETPSWNPPGDDPGWQMARDRERYRALLDRVPNR